MAHHAYHLIASPEEGIALATLYAQGVLGLSERNHPDIITLRHGLFSVDDARRLADMAYRAPLIGDQKALIVSATRMFHEAQNALLKVFEEPPEGTTIILVLPADGLLLPTLRSRLLPMPNVEGSVHSEPESVRSFLSATPKEREKLVAKLLDRTKSDKDEEKQAARAEAIVLIEGILRSMHGARTPGAVAAYSAGERHLVRELHSFLPILHERSAPLKLIFEHLLLVIPTKVA